MSPVKASHGRGDASVLAAAEELDPTSSTRAVAVEPAAAEAEELVPAPGAEELPLCTITLTIRSCATGLILAVTSVQPERQGFSEVNASAHHQLTT